MLIMAKGILAMMSGFVISGLFGLFLIPILKKVKIRQKVSIFLEDKHKKKEGTPTMGGLIFIIPTLLIIGFLLITGRIDYSWNLFLVLFVFLAYGVLGFIDDYLIIKRKSNDGLSEIQKLFGQLLIAIIFFLIFMQGGNDPILHIHTLNIRIDMGFLYGFFILFVLVGSSNAVNLTDGLDGLAGGLSVIAFLAYGMIALNASWIVGNEAIGIFAFVLVGSIMGFLLFNSHPAKVFMGDTGSLSLGATLASIAIVTSHELTLVIVAGVFIVETLSSIIQIFSVSYFGKKVFLMTPLHHHFEKLGWEETDIVKLFWSIGLVLSMAAITFGVWI